MARKLTFEDLPAAVERMLEILESNTQAGASVAALQKRITELERKIELLQAGPTPAKTKSDKPTARTKKEVSTEPTTPARRVGRPRKSAPATTPATVESAPETTIAEGKELIGAPYAAVMLGLKLGTIYQLTRTNKIPHIKEGAKILFDADVLKKWNRKRKSKRKSNKKRIQKPAAEA